ncbi:MAG: hypothetical protein JWO20_1217 [Candidatus Angelobacter sp.]|jgi:hypothetical protein|nr:hypothetical protein [Candidatus Angelobacter sp.]
MSKVINKTLILFAISLSVIQARAADPEKRALTAVHHHRSLRADLPNALAFISTEFQVPIIAEIAIDGPNEIVIPEGSDSAARLLDLIISQTKYNSWEELGGVAHVYNKELQRSTGNFLNTKLKSFKLPNNVSDLKIGLRAQLYSAAQGLSGTVISDFPSRELSKERLPSKSFRNATGRDILIAAAKLSPNFTSIIVFPRKNPKGKDDLDYAMGHWNWISLNRTEQPPAGGPPYQSR